MGNEIWLSFHPRNLALTKSSVHTSPCHVSGCEISHCIVTMKSRVNTGHPCYGQLTAVKIGYLLTNVT